MTSFLFSRIARVLGVLPLFVCLATQPATAQETARGSSSLALPEAPTPTFMEPVTPTPTSTDQASSAQYAMPAPQAKITEKYIPAGWYAQNLTATDKMRLGLRDLYTTESLVGYVVVGGYSHLLNGQPNYGTNKQAFAQRVGASAARDVSQGIFADVVLAPLFHEDPRYYVEGPSHGVLHRTLYAITRPLITRNDQNHSTINASLLVGYAGAAALTSAYYPQSNRNVRDVVSTYGGSIGGAAFGFAFQEFSRDLLESVHLRHKEGR